MREESLRTASHGTPFAVSFYVALACFIFKFHFISSPFVSSPCHRSRSSATCNCFAFHL